MVSNKSSRCLLKMKQRAIVIVTCSVCAWFVLSRYYITDSMMMGPEMSYASNVHSYNESEGQSVNELKQPSGVPRWTYQCRDNACVRTKVDDKEVLKSLEACWLTCGTHGSLWPFPKKERRGSGSDNTVNFLPENFQLVDVTAESEEVKRLIHEAFSLKLEFLKNYPGRKNRSEREFWPFSSFTGSNREYEYNVVKVSIKATSVEAVFKLTTDESYQLSIEDDVESDKSKIQLSVTIWAKTFFGVRHGIETLSQLIAFNKEPGCFQILRSYDVVDAPKFPYRGILVDSGRNFIPLSVLKRVIDGMAINKLNFLHWHITDSNSFAFHSKRVPEMTQYGALSEDQIYYPDEVKELVTYARVRGVKIIPELDAPSHAGNGWQFGKDRGLGDLAFYVNLYDDSWPAICGQPPCGILNPLNIHTYNILERLYADMFDVFDQDLFHQGGDEVNLRSWAMQSEMHDWLKAKDALSLWGYFQSEALKRLKKQSPNVTSILWTSKLTAFESVSSETFLDPRDYIFQVWEPSNSPEVMRLLNKGYSLILSYVDKLYLDWGMGTWLGKEQLWPYHMWQTFYDTNLKVSGGPGGVSKRGVLGGECVLWGEKVGPSELEVKLWPRAAALAENLWSGPGTRSPEVYTRMNYHVHRMNKVHHIPTGQLQPESCLHFHGHCSNPRDKYP